MKYLQVKSSSQKNKSESYVFIKSDAGVTKLPDNWTLEFFLNSKISTSNLENLPIFDLKLKETSTSEISSAIQIYVSASESNNYIFKIGEKTKILSESNLFRLWDHIAIVWAKDCSIIIYVNSNPILGINMSEVSFKDYNKFDKFLFTTYKGTNTVYFAGIKVYESIKYNKNGFLINYPTSSNTTIIPNSGNGHSIDFINNTSDEDKNILVVNDPEIIRQMTENINTEIFRMNFNDIDNVLSEEYKNYVGIQAGSNFSSNNVEMAELDEEVVYDLYDVKYRFSQMLRVKSDFIFSFNTDLGNIAANTGVSIDLLARHINQTSSSDFVKCYNANSSGQLASIKENGTGINVISSSDEATVYISYNASTLTASKRVGFRREIDNNKIIHYLQNIKCSSTYSYNNITFKNKINGIESSYNYSNNINTIHKPKYYSIKLNSGSKTVTIFVLLKAGDYIKLFRISRNNLFGSFDPSFYLFGPMIVNNTAIENKDNDKTNSLQNIQLLYPTPNSTNIYERSHSDDETHINKYYFIMEATSTTDIELTTRFSETGYPSEYASYPAVITISNTRERNLIKFRCPYPTYSNWTFECWVYLKQNNVESNVDASSNLCDLLYLSGLQYGYIGLKISPRLGNVTVCYDKKNIYSSNINTMSQLQVSSSTYSEQPKMKDSIGIKLNEWNHIAITCTITNDGNYNYGSTYGKLKIYINGSNNFEDITSFNLAYLHRIFLFTKSLNSFLIPAYTGVKVTFNSAKTSFNTTLTV